MSERERTAGLIADFLEVKSDRYDERRHDPLWKAVLEKWSDTYGAAKGAGHMSFTESARKANIEAITYLLGL